jgi:excisionase family DNA binding protein
MGALYSLNGHGPAVYIDQDGDTVWRDPLDESLSCEEQILLDCQRLALVSLDPAALDALARLVETRVLERLDDRQGWPEWLSVENAAAYLDVSPERVRKLIAAGKLPSYSEGPGCRRFLRRSEIDAAMSELGQAR